MAILIIFLLKLRADYLNQIMYNHYIQAEITLNEYKAFCQEYNVPDLFPGKLKATWW